MLSIIVPVYNTEQYLKRCVDSLLKQDLGKAEVIFVDDGSTDNSPKMCDDYAEKHPMMKVVHKKNGGLASARNSGMNNSEGEYLIFLDSDDWLEDNAIKEITDILERYSPDIVAFGCKKTDGNKVFRTSLQPGNGFASDMNKVRSDSINNSRLFEVGMIRSTCMHVFKKEIIEQNKLKFISEKLVLNEDYLFIMHYLLKAQSYYVINKAYYNYYTRQNSLTTSFLINMLDRKETLHNYYEEILKKENNEEFLYRFKLFHITNDYECLANECKREKPDVKEVKRILAAINKNGYIKAVRTKEQPLKAKIVLNVMRMNNARIYITYYKIFSITKKILKG